MKEVTLADLQAIVRDSGAFNELEDYHRLCKAFLDLMERMQPSRITSPTHNNYVFYRYDKTHGNKITRPLNTNLFIESADEFDAAFQRFMSFLAGLKQYRDMTLNREDIQAYIATSEINKVVYTLQQSIGSIGDSFENPNLSRKRIGQLFEVLIKLIIQEAGLACQSRTINVPIPGYPGYAMPYELDFVFSPKEISAADGTGLILETEIIGSVKTTSKDRIDKIFLEKYLLTKLLGREVPVIAIFLHDVQRAKAGSSVFAITSTFKSNHFLGYTVALNRLDGVYYVDLRPEMVKNDRLREQIKDFQTFLAKDLWQFK